MGARVRSLRVSSGAVEETKQIAAAVAGCCEVGDVVLLVGDLGAGKTVFAQGFARGLGVEADVTSPTFTLVNQYRCAHPPIESMLHADVYRLGGPAEVEDLGIGELVEDAAVAVVEWGDLAEPVLGRGALYAKIEPLDGDGGSIWSDVDPTVTGRQIVFEPVQAEDTSWSRRWDVLRGALDPWAGP